MFLLILLTKFPLLKGSHIFEFHLEVLVLPSFVCALFPILNDLILRIPKPHPSYGTKLYESNRQ